MTHHHRLPLSIAVVAMLAASGQAAAQDIVLRGITPWNADYDLSQSFFQFQELVEERLGDSVTVEHLGGPEIAAPNDQFEALRNGVVDVILGAAAYYRAEVPGAAAVQFTSLAPHELRESGYFDVMREIHAEQGGVVYLANTSGGNKFRMYLVDPIEAPDFSGMKLRVSPVYLPLVEALGGTAVSMAPGEVYTALERGAIDGYGWTYTGIDTFGWEGETGAIIDHPFYSLDGAILINQDVWDSLPADVQTEMEKIGAELEVRIESFMAERMMQEDEKLAEYGIEFVQFSEEDAAKFVDTAYEAGWADFLQRNPDLAADEALLDALLEAGR